MSGKRAIRRRGAGTASVALVLVLAGLLFAANARLAQGVDGRHPQNLAQLVAVESERAAELESEATALLGEIERFTELRGEGIEPADQARAELIAQETGRVAMTGPGLTVRLSDASPLGSLPSWVTNDDLVVHQQDLQAVINALWAGGAEAMGLQDQRVIATSGFRCVGNVLLLHGRRYSPPYTVRAIGDPEQLETALYAAPDVQVYLEYVTAVGLGWSVTVEEQVALPAYTGPLELRYAGVPPGVDPFDPGGST